MAKRCKSKKHLLPLPKFRYVVMACLASPDLDAELVDDADTLARDLRLDNLSLIEYGDAILQQAYETADGEIEWGPVAAQPALF